jgi:hypothetical protein
MSGRGVFDVHDARPSFVAEQPPSPESRFPTASVRRPEAQQGDGKPDERQTPEHEGNIAGLALAGDIFRRMTRGSGRNGAAVRRGQKKSRAVRPGSI